MNKETLEKRIRDLCYDEWNALKTVKEDTKVRYDNYDYGVEITTYDVTKFNWDFEDFVARITLMDEYKLRHWKNTYFWNGLDTNAKINDKMWFMPNVAQYFPRKNQIYDGVCYGDGNDAFCFIQFGSCYMCIHGYGS